MKNKTKMTAAVELVTPAKAKQFLKLNDNIRKPNQRKIKSLARDMRTGHWEENGESIAFFQNGKGEVLRNGQNRLHAVVESGISQRFVVVRGIAGSDYVDVGEKRTIAQLLTHEGIPYANVMAGAISNLIGLDHFKSNPAIVANARPSHSDRIECFNRYRKQLMKWVPVSHNTKRLLWRQTICAVMIHGTNPADYPMAKQDFLDCLATGLNGSETLSNHDACYALRELYADDARSRIWRTQRWKLGMVVKCWNWHRDQTLMPTPKLRFVETGPTAEQFPRVR